MSEERRKPAIRFKGFTGDWERRMLGDISNSFSGGTPLVGVKEFYGGDIPFIRSAEINSDSTELFITEKGLKYSSAKIICSGDILYALYGATSGEVGRARLMGAINQAILDIKPHDEYSAEFITQWLRKSKQSIIDTYLQGGQGNLSSGIVKNLVIKFPSLNEQETIGSFCINLDTYITLHQRKYDKLVCIKKAMLEKMFPQNGSCLPEIRFVGFADAWERRRLCEIADFGKGQGYSKSDLGETGNPIILYGRLYTKYQTIIRDVDTFADVINSAVFSKGGEVILPASGETAEDIAIASSVEKAGILLGGGLNVVIPNKNIDSAFLAIEISFGTPHNDLVKRAQGKSIVHLYNEDLKDVFISYPSIEEQRNISKLFDTLDHLITLQQRALDKLKTLKKAFLEKMFV